MDKIEFALPGDCPSGEICPVHFRLNDAAEKGGFYSEITYVGDYAVVTSANPDVDILTLAAYELLGLGGPRNAYLTSIFRVGEGTLYDLTLDGKGLAPERTVPSDEVPVAREVHSIAVRWAERQK